MIEQGLDDNFEVKGNITEHFSIEFHTVSVLLILKNGLMGKIQQYKTRICDGKYIEMRNSDRSEILVFSTLPEAIKNPTKLSAVFKKH